MVVGYVPPIHIVHLLSHKIQVAIFTCMRWCKISMALITKLCVSWFAATTPIVIPDQCFILYSTYQSYPKQASMMNRLFHSAQTINLHSHSWSKTMFSLAIDLQHFSHGLLIASSLLECGPCKNETVKDTGKLCFESTIVKKLAFALPFNSYCPKSTYILVLTADWYTFSWQVGQSSIVGVFTGFYKWLFIRDYLCKCS